jgi:hypothetical protein
MILFDPSVHFISATDYVAGSLLVLGKYSFQSIEERGQYAIRHFILKTGTRKEYLNIVIDNPEYDLYYVHPNYPGSNDINELVRQIDRLEMDDSGNRIFML